MRELVAALPPLVAAGLLLRGVAAPRAAAAALAVAAASLSAFPTPWPVLLESQHRALTTGLEVTLITLGGLLFREVLAASRAEAQLGDWAAALSGDPVRRVLLVALGVVPFTESAAGFGVGAIVGIPLLLRMGLPPATAALVALLGLVAVPWGGLAPGTLVAARLSGISFQRLGELSAALSLPVFLVCGFSALAAVVGARRALLRAHELALVAACLWLGIAAANRLAGTALAGVLGGAVAVGGSAALIRVHEGRVPRPTPSQLRALSPYLALVALLLLSRAVAGLGRSLAATGTGRALSAASSPGLWLLLACIAAALLVGLDRRALAGAVRRSLARLRPVSLATIAFLATGSLMTAAGMSAALAEAASRLGPAYLLAAPWLGGLGGFLTGSNTGANAMFAAAQAEAAVRLGWPPDRLLAVHNVAASLLTMASAPRVTLALSLLDGERPEPGLFRRLLATDAAALALLSLLAAVAVPGR